ncbi:MAG: 3-hydroxyacyl-CoA dehydrogenase family protein [Betaproteobacteria bacterium]|nr:3-hydroxyacyl-CoA dehydrogenase family protein [Betaproteobacteria bacterium]
MGHGIAYIFASAGHKVSLHDAHAPTLESAPKRIESLFELIGADKAGLANLEYRADFAQAVANADFVFEAVAEKPEVKQAVFAKLDETAPAKAILCTNTSAIPIKTVGAKVKNQKRVIGTHYWNPPHLIPLVEVVQAEFTAQETVDLTMALLTAVGMTPVHVKKDIPGFIGNRLQHALKRECIALVANGVCDAETVDKVVKQGFGARLAVIGPLEQSDMVGLGLTLDIHKVLIADLDRTPGPDPFLIEKVAKGETGMAVGQGFRKWTPEQAAEVRTRLNQFLVDAARSKARRS